MSLCHSRLGNAWKCTKIMKIFWTSINKAAFLSLSVSGLIIWSQSQNVYLQLKQTSKIRNWRKRQLFVTLCINQYPPFSYNWQRYASFHHFSAQMASFFKCGVYSNHMPPYEEINYKSHGNQRHKWTETEQLHMGQWDVGGDRDMANPSWYQTPYRTTL